ncbi:alpha/beta fold hydrolase [Microbacterium sp. SORGH_AS_0421]|uniref:alpha/beta fold hydrolase n=1 Tax=Microbacterium sp. SORGH_AS_0421 TaxID=3041768 RepID=UPI0027D785A9|nr:hypothetical protein [Microbacterium sp. SORGH_AS_0421]
MPVTILSGQLDAEALPRVLAEWGAYAEEVDRLDSLEVVRLGSGHWPQFSQPQRFAEKLVAAVR